MLPRVVVSAALSWRWLLNRKAWELPILPILDFMSPSRRQAPCPAERVSYHAVGDALGIQDRLRAGAA